MSDDLQAKIASLEADLAVARGVCDSFAARILAQSTLLSQRAEKVASAHLLELAEKAREFAHDYRDTIPPYFALYQLAQTVCEFAVKDKQNAPTDLLPTDARP